jgi:hypothetical protein
MGKKTQNTKKKPRRPWTKIPTPDIVVFHHEQKNQENFPPPEKNHPESLTRSQQNRRPNREAPLRILSSMAQSGKLYTSPQFRHIDLSQFLRSFRSFGEHFPRCTFDFPTEHKTHRSTDRKKTRSTSLDHAKSVKHQFAIAA